MNTNKLNPLLDKSLKVYSVSEITENIKILLKSSFPSIYIKGELSNVRKSSLKHVFFNLKDEKSIINCVIFENDLNKLKFHLEDGLKIIGFGNISVFERRGTYNFIVKDVLPEGKGPLQLAFEQLKEKLEKKGLFRIDHKKQIVEFPEKIGIITALHGAALRDIIKIINQRYATINIVIYPALVQGENAYKTIIKGIKVFNRFFPVDVIILTRGGGSIEDLWAFNEEKLANAIYESKIPIMSAVGHEIDYTIADYVADKRAPTPSAAAELVIYKKLDIIEQVRDYGDNLQNFIDEKIKEHKMNFAYVLEQYKNLTKNILKAKLNNFILLFQTFIQTIQTRFVKENNRFSHLFTQFKNNCMTRLIKEKNNFKNLANQLALLNPFLILKRGYSITYKFPENKIVKDEKNIKVDDKVKIKLFKGELYCHVEKK